MNNPTFNQGLARKNFIVILTIGFALILGASYLVLPYVYAPLIVLTGLAGITIVFLWLAKPTWAVYIAIFIVLLPTSLIPAEINSLLNRAATVLALGVWIIDFIGRRRKIIFTFSMGLMIGFLLWSAISFIWAANKTEAATVLQTYALRFILFFLLICHEIRKKGDLEGLMNVLALSGVFLVVVSIFFLAVEGYVPGTRLQVLDVNENELGLNLLMTAPGLFWWAVRPTRRFGSIKKLLAVAYLVTAIGLTGLSGSRGSAISWGITLLAFLFWESTRKWGIYAIVIAVIAIILTPFVFTTTIDRFLGVPGDTLLGGREYIWPAAWQLIQDHLLTGVGIGNSSFAIIPYMINNGAQWVALSSDPLHNPVLVIWAETGFPGLLIYLGVLVSASISFFVEYLRSRKMQLSYYSTYFELVAAMFLGFMASWIKGGGMETSFAYFLVLSLLIIPKVINKSSFQELQS